MADIPGIIEGASQGKGLGLRFLRHIERNSVLLFVIPADSPDVRQEYNTLLNELREYNPELMDKDRLLAISKIDTVDELDLARIKGELPEKLPVTFISAVSQRGLNELKDQIWQHLTQTPAPIS
jgi:GTP-binding protein